MVRHGEAGFSIVEVLIVLAIISIIVAIAIPELHQARERAEIGAMAGDCRTLYVAFKEYYVHHGTYPNASDSPSFDLDTYDPLRSGQYYRGNLNRFLLSNRPDGYDSPDDGGSNQEFWLEMSLSLNPGIRMVVANSNDAPLSGGEWLDGIYLYRNGVLARL